ncbi:rhomboid family protein [Luminiphilus syltensis NOR5-1B]|uniref:Rhomboid family protein n=1 Tax=Luminiphilus syltensis NOR5-1B TaxID=565045 RepID=B8KXW2_9GAMM|nr:rhomboid family intramembrane serine protease [Luminiphilus syltensis]EED36148.1 rhomboid family protein [Luminiphilus syltensis NOR5-1B]
MPLSHSVRHAPGTLGLIVISVVCFLLFHQLGWLSVLQAFNFVPFDEFGGMIQFGEPGADFWRFVTPAFIHFSWLHLAFNSLWLWEFGQRIEQRVGTVNLLGLFLLSAGVSNGIQYLVSGPSIFGGLSGVVYAFLGFLWAASLVRPGWIIPPPRPILLFMLGWLIVGFLGVLEFLGVGAIANGAHLGGLAVGFALGGLFAILSRLQVR